MGFVTLLNLDWKNLLLLGLLQLVLPLLDAGVGSAQGEQFLLVVNQFGATRAGERVIFLQEDGFLGTHFLAEAAEDAAKHVDLKLLRHLFGIGPVGGRAIRAWRN